MAETSPRDSLSRQRRVRLIFLYFAFVFTGVLDGFLLGMPIEKLRPDFFARVQLLTACLLSLGSMWFCTADAKLAGKPLIQLAKLGIFLGWPVGVPIYLLWAHGIRGLGLLLLHGFSLVFISILSILVTAYAVYGSAAFE